MRLEVTVSPYKFGMKRAYPARHSLDISSCQYISLTMPLLISESHPLENISTSSDHAQKISSNITLAASQLRELREIEKELSIAQRWVHGKIITLLDNLSSSLGGANNTDASILLALSKKDTMHEDDISRTFNISPLILFERLEILEKVGLINKTRESTWRLN
jgi:ArsR family transcriptional regulator